MPINPLKIDWTLIIIFPVCYCLFPFFSTYSSKGTEGVLEVKTTRDDNHNSTDKLQPEIHHPSSDVDEMVSQTENARLNAWKTSEVIKKAAISRVPPRVGSATSRVMVTPSTSPPPQRPSSPIESCSVPLRPADQWLAGGRDINRASVKHVSVWLPGWMDGLESSRRPKSSPVLRGPKYVQLYKNLIIFLRNLTRHIAVSCLCDERQSKRSYSEWL